MMNEEDILSKDGTKLHVRTWLPTESPRAVMILVHGSGNCSPCSCWRIAPVASSLARTRPVLVLHGTEDHVTLPSGTKHFGQIGGSADKTLNLYPGYFHDLLNDVGKERVLGDVMSWLDGHLRLRAA